MIELLMKRKSMRVFEERPVSDETKRTLLQASLRAATAGNMTLYTHHYRCDRSGAEGETG